MMLENDRRKEKVNVAAKKKTSDKKVTAIACIIPQYATLKKHGLKFVSLLNSLPDKKTIPIEWIVDVADECNGWFFATAYSYNDREKSIHIMVPDKNNPVYEGDINLDYRLVHLVECIDGNSAALFNKLIRDSMIKVRWQLEWFDGELEGDGDDNNGIRGRWLLSMARYYIQFSNQLLIESPDFFETGKYVLIVADLGVRLLTCVSGKGYIDFSRLIQEDVVLSSKNALSSQSRALSSNLEAALSVASLNDVCFVPHLRTSEDQLASLQSHVDCLPHNAVVPVEWTVDVADESNGWFFATAYSYNDHDNTIHIMVPDRNNPVYEGDIKLDCRQVRLVECSDSSSTALFNKILRDSIIKVRWQIEWCNSEPSADEGEWILSAAHYYFQFSNQMMVRSEATEGKKASRKGFFVISANHSVRFLRCDNKSGLAEYERLIREGAVLRSPTALDVSHLLQQQLAPVIPEVITYERMQIVAPLSSPYRIDSSQPSRFREQKDSHHLSTATESTSDGIGDIEDVVVHPSPRKTKKASLGDRMSPVRPSISDLQLWLQEILGADVDEDYITHCHQSFHNDFIRSKDALCAIPPRDFDHDYLKSIGISKVSVRWIIKKNHSKLYHEQNPTAIEVTSSISSASSSDSEEDYVKIEAVEEATIRKEESTGTTSKGSGEENSSGLRPTFSTYDPASDPASVAVDEQSQTSGGGSSRRSGDGANTSSSEGGSFFRASVAHPDENIQVLKQQLQTRNIKPLEFIPLSDIRSEIQSLTQKANEGEPFDEERLDFLIACMEINDEYIAEKDAERQAWASRLKGFTRECIDSMRSYIPPDIHRATTASLAEQGLHQNLVKRIMKKKCLWLVRMEPSYISRLHEADLFGTYSPACQQLDIVETTAVYGCLPDKFQNDASGKKRDWKLRLEEDVRKLVSAKENNKLSASLCRAEAYKLSGAGPFGDTSELFSINVTSSEGAFAPKNDFLEISTSSGRRNEESSSQPFSPKRVHTHAKEAAKVISASANCAESVDDGGIRDKNELKNQLETLFAKKR